MNINYVIYCPQKGGYWSEAAEKFKGELYATKYNSRYLAENEYVNNIRNDIDFFIEIKKVYS